MSGEINATPKVAGTKRYRPNSLIRAKLRKLSVVKRNVEETNQKHDHRMVIGRKLADMSKSRRERESMAFMLSVLQDNVENQEAATFRRAVSSIKCKIYQNVSNFFDELDIQCKRCKCVFDKLYDLEIARRIGGRDRYRRRKFRRTTTGVTN